MFGKRQGWLTSQSQLCQQGARLCGSSQARCAGVSCEGKPLPSHLGALPPSFLSWHPAPVSPLLTTPLLSQQGGAWVKGPDSNGPAEKLLSLSLSPSREGATRGWEPQPMAGEGCARCWAAGPAQSACLWGAALQLVYGGSHAA